ncbi:MAG: chemotaxis protein CheD [Candidatus Tritonobacter lacicola]|nr:chemotaxis protein CheD [Candidatus Tritonobacter lacicola]
MKRIITIQTGEVEFGSKDAILKSSGIGSCVVITAYSPDKKIGVIAHVMLPGASPGGKDIQRTRYAADAIDEVIDRMKRSGVGKDDIEVCLVGGGNVLRREDDGICEQNIESIIEIFNDKHIEIRAQVLGGAERRSVSLDVDKGTVHYTEGDGKEKLLWGEGNTDQ